MKGSQPRLLFGPCDHNLDKELEICAMRCQEVEIKARHAG